MTKETEKAFKILYCEYKRRRKSGDSKRKATLFTAETINEMEAFSDWNNEDIRYALQELKRAGFVRLLIYGGLELTEAGITFMEDKPADFFKGLSPFFDLISLFV